MATLASSKAAMKGARAATVNSRTPPLPANADKRMVESVSKSGKWRAGECQQSKPLANSSASSRQLGAARQETKSLRALSTRSRSLDTSSSDLARSAGPSRLVCGVGGVSEQPVPQSASLCSHRRRVEVLESENAQLKTELKRVRAMYDQLAAETPEERFDERRVLLLKGQVIQLERQVLLLSQSLNDRSTAMLEVDNLTEHIQHLLRSNATGKGSAAEEEVSSSKTVHLSRNAQKELLTLCREVRSRLSTSITQQPAEQLAEVMLFSNPFARQGSDLTVLDVCTGGLSSLNLKHVARLESQLAHLYHNLEQLQPNLTSLSLCRREDCCRGKPVYSPPHTSRAGCCHSPAKDLLTAPCALPSVSLRCNTLLSDTLPLLRGCCCSLLSLSLLVPAAPWPPLQSEAAISLTVTPEEVVKSLSLTGHSKREVKEKLSSVWKCFQHALVLQKEKINALETETAYHSSVHKVQVEYTHHLLSALSDGYQSFQQSMSKDLSAPLQALLVGYNELRETASEETLSQFLITFKNNSDCLKRALDDLQRQSDKHLGVDTMLELHRQFEAAIQARV